ncbi:MFS general substrate transporter [Meredithblackwellia eburnea MCA 4105]
MSRSVTSDTTSDSKAELGSVTHFERAPAAAGKSKLAPIDEAAAIVEDGVPIEVSVEEDRRVLRKIDLWVMAPMAVIYFLQQLDKSSLSYTSVFGIVNQTHLVGTQYSWLSSVVYLAQLVMQPINARMLVKVPVAKWVTFNLLCWGICVACTAAAKDFKGLLIARMFLGIFEACVAPSFILLVQTWWRRREQTYRTMAWNASNAVAGTLGPLLSYGIGHISVKGMYSYQWIFIVLGLITVATVPFIYFTLPSSPVDARFLRHGDDRKIAVERLRANNTGVATHVWKWPQFWETLRDPKSYLWMLLLFLAACPSGGIGAFGGLIVASFGYDPFTTILFQMPFGALQFCVIVFAGWATNKWRVRWIVIVIATFFPIAGAAMLLHLPRGPSHKGPLLAAYYLVSVLGTIQPLLYSWSNLNAAGHTKKVTTTAMLFVAQCVGNVAGPLLYKTSDKPYYHPGLQADLICWSLLAGIATFTGMYLKYLNRRQEKRREALGRKGRVLDTSLMTLEEVDQYKREANEEIAENKHAFEDLTDFENPDFIYVI